MNTNVFRKVQVELIYVSGVVSQRCIVQPLEVDSPDAQMEA